MIKYGKTSQNAIAAVSYLAQHYDGGQSMHSSLEIAEARHLPKPMVAKILTVLAQGGLVKGSPGPRGGYTLARPPVEITLHDVVCRFDREDNGMQCPFGPGWCGTGAPCPLHDTLSALDRQVEGFLSTTTFEVFSRNPQGKTAKAKR